MIWYKDLSGFITADNYHEFFPASHMHIEEQMNSIVRFSVYLSILLILLKQNFLYIYIALITMVFSYIFMYYILLPQSSNFKKKSTLTGTLTGTPTSTSKSKKRFKSRSISNEDSYVTNTNDLYNSNFSDKIIHSVPSYHDDEYLQFLYGKK
jgi:hypothetical protein